MAEKQATHRQQIEKTVIESNAFAQKVAPFLGFIITMTAIGGGIELILKGKDVYRAGRNRHGFGLSCWRVHLR